MRPDCGIQSVIFIRSKEFGIQTLDSTVASVGSIWLLGLKLNLEVKTNLHPMMA